jgi:hypothetical protein
LGTVLQKLNKIKSSAYLVSGKRFEIRDSSQKFGHEWGTVLNGGQFYEIGQLLAARGQFYKSWIN